MKEVVTFYSESWKRRGNRQPQKTEGSVTQDESCVQGSLATGGEIEEEVEDAACVMLAHRHYRRVGE